jgi:ABC-type branched-subunit amino acid transport system permease subunit
MSNTTKASMLVLSITGFALSLLAGIMGNWNAGLVMVIGTGAVITAMGWKP